MYRELRGIFPEVSLIAAGGISSLDDIRWLKGHGLAGTVLGKSLYEGTIDLKEAIREASSC
jgi:phosphoribosylformimino-5-aminoimidazole carboxamide ribotide isomerase